MKKIIWMVLFFAFISSVCYCTDPTNYFLRVKITLKNGQVFEGYLPTNIEMEDGFSSNSLPVYMKDLEDELNYQNNHITIDKYLILLNAAIQHSYEGYDENTRAAYFKNRKLIIYKNFIKADKDVSWAAIVDEDDVKIVSVSNIGKIVKDERLPTPKNNAAGLNILNKSEIDLYKSGSPKVEITLNDDSSLSFSKVFFYENFSLSKILDLMFCIEHYGSLEYKGLKLDFSYAEDMENNIDNINSSSLSKDEKEALLEFCNKTKKLFLDGEHISLGCDKCKHLVGLDELKKKYKVVVFRDEEE